MLGESKLDSKLRHKMIAEATVDRCRQFHTKLNHRGHGHVEQVRNGKLIKKVSFENDITTEGKNYYLDIMFGGATQITTWYIGLVDNAGFSSFLDADTLASHTGWSELTPGTDYTGNRLAWDEGTASAGSLTSTSTTDFPMLTTKTVYGMMLASVATGSSGKLFATAAFSSTIAVVNGDTLKVTYTVSY